MKLFTTFTTKFIKETQNKIPHSRKSFILLDLFPPKRNFYPCRARLVYIYITWPDKRKRFYFLDWNKLSSSILNLFRIKTNIHTNLKNFTYKSIYIDNFFLCRYYFQASAAYRYIHFFYSTRQMTSQEKDFFFHDWFRRRNGNQEKLASFIHTFYNKNYFLTNICLFRIIIKKKIINTNLKKFAC